jgi:hypothetical protein
MATPQILEATVPMLFPIPLKWHNSELVWVEEWPLTNKKLTQLKILVNNLTKAILNIQLVHGILLFLSFKSRLQAAGGCYRTSKKSTAL